MTFIDFFLSLYELFRSIELANIFDIAIVAVIIYIALVFIKQSHSFFIFSSIVILLGLAYLSRTFDLGLTRQLFQPILTFFILIFIIVFQREIRRFFEWFSVSGRRLATREHISISRECTEIVTKTVDILAKKSIGAIIVLTGKHPVDRIIQGGYDLGGKISIPLLLSIFHTRTPGHDGAVIVRENIIEKFGVHLPLADDFRSRNVGTRHRAAIGIAEQTDALAVVVSEERGTISVAYEGYLKKISDIEELEEIVGDFTKEQAVTGVQKGLWHYFIFRNWIEKISSIVIAVLLWVILVFQAGIITSDYIVPVEFKSLSKDLIADRVDDEMITVTLSGRDRDVANTNVSQLGISVDLGMAEIGEQELKLSETNVEHPSYLEVINISPDSIIVNITQKETEEESDLEVEME